MKAGRELDALVAEKVMGYTVERGIADYGGHPMPWMTFHDGDKVYNPIPYSTDIAAVRLVEDEIERRGLVGPYVKALYAIVGKKGSWALLRATPEQRCHAALRSARAAPGAGE